MKIFKLLLISFLGCAAPVLSTDRPFLLTAIDYSNFPNYFIRIIDPGQQKIVRTIKTGQSPEIIWFPQTNQAIFTSLALSSDGAFEPVVKFFDQNKWAVEKEQPIGDLLTYSQIPMTYAPVGLSVDAKDKELVLDIKGQEWLGRNGMVRYEEEKETLEIKKILPSYTEDDNPNKIRIDIYSDIKKAVDRTPPGALKKEHALGYLVREGWLRDFRVKDDMVYALAERPSFKSQKKKVELQLYHLKNEGKKIGKKRVLPQPRGLKPYLDSFAVFDGTLTYLFIGFGDGKEENPITDVWVYDVEKGRALKKYKLEMPLESLVSAPGRGQAYAARSHGDMSDHIFHFDVESAQAQPSAWRVQGRRLVLVERRYPDFRLFRRF